MSRLTELRPPSTTVADGRLRIGATSYYSLPGCILISASTRALVAETIYYEPIIVSSPITIDRLIIEVTAAAAAGKIARLGIYQADKNWQPTTLVVDAGTVLVDANAVVAATINSYLSTGRYLVVCVSDSTPTLRSTIAGMSGSGFIVSTLGANLGAYLWTVAAGGSGVLANPGVAITGGVATSGGVNHYVFLRVSSP